MTGAAEKKGPFGGYAPGLHADVPNRVYHGLTEAVNNSHLKRLDACPAAAKVEQEETDAMLFGRALHVYVLEGRDAFDLEVAIAPAGLNLRTNAGKDAMAAFQVDNLDKVIIKPEQFDTIVAMDAAVRKHPLAADILSTMAAEVTGFWYDKATGLPCKCRADMIPYGGKRCLADLKSTADASEHGFSRAVTQFKYYRQEPWYIDGVNEAGKLTGDKAVDTMIFIAVEKTEPYRTEVYVLDDDFVKLGRQQNAALMQIEKECREKNFWPNYKYDGAVDLFKPNWMV